MAELHGRSSPISPACVPIFFYNEAAGTQLLNKYIATFNPGSALKSYCRVGGGILRCTLTSASPDMNLRGGSSSDMFTSRGHIAIIFRSGWSAALVSAEIHPTFHIAHYWFQWVQFILAASLSLRQRQGIGVQDFWYVVIMTT